MDSYIRPHRHLNDPKVECLIAVRGLLTLIVFDDSGDVVQSVRFGEQSEATGKRPSIGVEVQPGTWHTVIAERPGSVLFEVKSGPFRPEQAKEWAEWAPADESPDVFAYLADLRRRITR